jgi:hypothetical protein
MGAGAGGVGVGGALAAEPLTRMQQPSPTGAATTAQERVSGRRRRYGERFPLTVVGAEGLVILEDLPLAEDVSQKQAFALRWDGTSQGRTW